MPLINVRGHLPGTGEISMIIVDTGKISFITPCPGCNLVQIHCSGTYFETDRFGTNMILNSLGGTAVEKDIILSEGYEKVIEWHR